MQSHAQQSGNESYQLEDALKNSDLKCEYASSPTLVKNTLDYCLAFYECRYLKNNKFHSDGTVGCKSSGEECPALRECAKLTENAKVAIYSAASPENPKEEKDKKDRGCSSRTKDPIAVWVEWFNKSKNESQMIPFCATPIQCTSPVPDEPPPTFAVCGHVAKNESVKTDNFYPQLVCPPVNQCLNQVGKNLKPKIESVVAKIKREPNSESQQAGVVPFPHAAGAAPYNAPATNVQEAKRPIRRTHE